MEIILFKNHMVISDKDSHMNYIETKIIENTLNLQIQEGTNNITVKGPRSELYSLLEGLSYLNEIILK